VGVAEGDQGRVRERRESGVFERGQEQAFYELVGSLAPGPVAHVYTRRGELRRPAAVLLQGVEDPLLPLAHPFDPISTFSNDLRPKL
jgi:hypothetical protein